MKRCNIKDENCLDGHSDGIASTSFDVPFHEHLTCTSHELSVIGRHTVCVVCATI